MRALSEMRQKFCQEYIIDCDGLQAAIRAGYSPKNADVMAAKLRANVQVRKYINELMDARAEKVGVTAEWVLANLQSVYEKCMALQPAMKYSGNKWIETGQYTFDSSGALRALELIARHIGFFEKDNLTKPPININLTAIDIKYISDRLEENV